MANLYTNFGFQDFEVFLVRHSKFKNMGEKNDPFSIPRRIRIFRLDCLRRLCQRHDQRTGHLRRKDILTICPRKYSFGVGAVFYHVVKTLRTARFNNGNNELITII